MVWFDESRQGDGLVALLQQHLAVIPLVGKLIYSVNSGITRVSLFEVAGHYEGSSQVLVLLSLDVLLPLWYGYVYAGLWRDIVHCDDCRCDLAGQVEGMAHDSQMPQVRRAGQREKINLSFIMKQTPPPLDLPDSSILSMQTGENNSAGVTRWSGIRGFSQVSVKQRMRQAHFPDFWPSPVPVLFHYVIWCSRGFLLVSDQSQSSWKGKKKWFPIFTSRFRKKGKKGGKKHTQSTAQTERPKRCSGTLVPWSFWFLGYQGNEKVFFK